MNHSTAQAPDNPLLQNPGGIYSQAENFWGLVQSAVDARTGQFHLAVTLPAVHANDLSGPSLAPVLSFSSLASQQNRGWGLGWSLILSELVLSPTSSSLRLASGEQFAVDWDESDLSIGGKLVFADQKLKAVQVKRLSNSSFQVDSKSGEIEILTQQNGRGAFVLAELRSAEGHRLFLDWLPFGDGDNILSAIRDERRTLLHVKREDGQLEIHVNPDSSDPFIVQLWLANNRLSNVKLPAIESTFDFLYESLAVGTGQTLLFAKQVSGPLGAEDSVLWSSSTSGHRLPAGAPIEYLPYVTSWTHSTGDPENALYHGYEWIGTRNYLGFGSDVGFVWDNSRDNLYQVNNDYDYSAVETQTDQAGKVLATITRVWNRFHLQTLEATVRGQLEVRVETVYGIDRDTSWSDQPAYCQLPHLVTTTYQNHDKARLESTTAQKPEKTQRAEKTAYTYDDYGNVLTTCFPSGLKEICIYYPADDRPQCPKDALGMVRYLEKKTRIPAPSGVPTPTLSTLYTYENLPSLVKGDDPHAVVVKEQAWNETTNQELEATVQTYISTVGPHYGRQESAVTTLNGRSTTTHYSYTLENNRLRTDVTVEGYDFDPKNLISRSTRSDSRSVLTGLTTEQISAAGVITAYEYDTLGRIVRTLIAKGSDFETARSCTYHLNDSFIKDHRAADVVSTVAIEETDASGRRLRSWLDGYGRAVSIQLEDLDNAPGTFREVLRTRYDPLGRVIEQTSAEWRDDGEKAFELTSLTHYGDWGYAMSTTSPTGLITHTPYDPIELRAEQWQESPSGQRTGKQVTFSNTSGSPTKHQLYDDQGRRVRTTVMERDGLDRMVEQRLLVTGEPDIVTHYTYDAYSRVVEQTRPDATRIGWTYAPHSDDDHPESIQVTEPDSAALAGTTPHEDTVMPNTAAIAGLHHFQLKGNGSPNDQQLCRVYRNSRQQFYITVVIDAYDDRGQIVDLSPAQLKTIKFIRYDDGGELKGFTRSDTKDRYEYFPGTRAEAADAPDQNMSSIAFWFTLNDAVQTHQMQIAAQITLDGVTYRTNDRNAPPGGAGGPFNSSVLAQAVEPYVFDASYFQIVNLGTIGSGLGEPYRTYFHKWEITFKDSGYRILDSSVMDKLLVGWFGQFAGKDNQYAFYNLPVRPVGSLFRGGYLKDGSGPHKRDWYVYPYTRAGAAYAIMQQDNLTGDDDYVSQWTIYYDQYGCSHRVLLETYDNGSKFRISNAIGGHESGRELDTYTDTDTGGNT